MCRIEDEDIKQFEHQDLTGKILNCCFEVMNELGPGFLEKVYKNALYIALQQNGFKLETEKPFQVTFRGLIIGRYIADLVVENLVVIELKCCDQLIPEHQAQLINYLTVAKIPIGLLVNFQHRKLEYKRLYRPR